MLTLTRRLLAIAVIFMCLLSSALTAQETDYLTIPKAVQTYDLNDDDRDGVINARDKCLETLAEAAIDNDGCAQKIQHAEKLELQILFANDSALISPAFLSEIDKMVNFLQTYPETSVKLNGYASQVGNKAYNLALSKQRAEAVRGKLLRSGISISRIEIVGYGETALDSRGNDEQTQAFNRRVTATVVGYNSDILREWTIFTRRAK